MARQRSPRTVTVDPRSRGVNLDAPGRDEPPPPPPLVGVGPETPTTTTPQGGVHSDVPYRFDLVDPAAMSALARVLDYGIRRGYPVDNWRCIDTNAHLNHVLMHINAHLYGDTQDEHLEHAFTRLMFALGVELQGGVRSRA